MSGMKLPKLKVSEYEELRNHNIADNKAMLTKLMGDLKKLGPIPGQTPTRSNPQKPRKYSSRRLSEPVVVRRNPSRQARYTPYGGTEGRTRRGSVSSSTESESSSATTSPYKQDGSLRIRLGTFSASCNNLEDYSDDEQECPPRLTNSRRVSRVEREITPVEDITDQDLEMVAETVADKRYDADYGSTCHQCRQKTLDMKTVCRSDQCTGIRGRFCGPCLRNRYGEQVKDALKDPEWVCPPCRGICNCSICRRRAGKSSTGMLVHLAREYGYGSVKDYLSSLKKA